MSINFSEDDKNQDITTTASIPEDAAEGSLRPKTIAEYGRRVAHALEVEVLVGCRISAHDDIGRL